MKKTLVITFVIFLVSCAPMATPVPTETQIPTATFTFVPPTNMPTPKPTDTKIPITYESIGELFSSDCAKGLPSRIWSNNSFNAPFKQAFDDNHGHMDIYPPTACKAESVQMEVLAPISATIEKYDYGDGYGFFLYMPENTFPQGIESALSFAGVANPDLKKISEIKFALAHLDIPFSSVVKGQAMGDLTYGSYNGHYKLAFQVIVIYGGVEYMLSPTLFTRDGSEWICFKGSPYDCEPEPKDYAP